MLAMLLHRLISTVYLNRADICYFTDRAYVRYRTGTFYFVNPPRFEPRHGPYAAGTDDMGIYIATYIS